MPIGGSTSKPFARPTWMTSAPRYTAMRRTPGSVRHSAVPRPLRPASGFSMQLTASLDQRSPHRFVVTFAPATAVSRSATRRALGIATVVLADLEADMAGVRAHGDAGLVHAGANRDHATQRAMNAGHGSHSVVVDAVLEVDNEPVVLEVLHAEPRRPLGVVRLHRDEEQVERLRDRLRLVHVQRLHGDRVITARAGEPQAASAHRLDVLGPLIDQRDVVARLRAEAAPHPAH